MPDINLSPYTAEYEAIQQRRKLAELLSQQGSEPIQMPTQAGVRISPLQGLAKMFEVYSGQKGIEKAQQEQKGLAERIRSQGQDEVSQFLEAIQGKAAVPEMEKAGPAPENAMRDGGYIQPAQEAVAPDMRKALSVALSAQANPTVQGAGGALLANMLKPPESAFAKLNPKDYTPDSVKTFMASGGKDFSLLKPLEKLMTTDTGQVIQGRNPYTFEPVGAPVAKQVGVDTTAQLTQARELSDRAFSQLSANQRASLANEAKRIGISAQQLFFDTGMQAGGNAPVGAPAPTVTPNVALNASPRSYVPFGATQGNAALSPKAQQEIAKAIEMEKVIPKPLTESQGNATAYGMRMAEANKILTDLENKGVTNTGAIRSTIAGTVGMTPFIGEKLGEGVNAVMNPLPGVLGGPSGQQQQVDQARRNFITAVLRKESGASISPSEFANEEKKYFPQVGDVPAVLKQKQDARELAIKAMNVQAGSGAKSIGTSSSNDPLGLR
jgi:hypothetical protein